MIAYEIQLRYVVTLQQSVTITSAQTVTVCTCRVNFLDKSEFMITKRYIHIARMKKENLLKQTTGMYTLTHVQLCQTKKHGLIQDFPLGVLTALGRGGGTNIRCGHAFW